MEKEAAKKAAATEAASPTEAASGVWQSVSLREDIGCAVSSRPAESDPSAEASLQGAAFPRGVSGSDSAAFLSSPRMKTPSQKGDSPSGESPAPSLPAAAKTGGGGDASCAVPSSSTARTAQPPPLSSWLREVGVLTRGAHAFRSASCTCSDRLVFVGGSGVIGTVFVWQIRGRDGDAGETPSLRFRGLFARMASQVVSLALSPQEDRLLAVTLSGLAYVWDVSPNALAKLDAALSLAGGQDAASVSACAASAWSDSASSCLLRSKRNFFSAASDSKDPRLQQQLQQGLFDSSELFELLVLHSPRPICVLGARGGGLAALDDQGSRLAMHSFGDDLQAAVWLQEGRLIAACSSAPSPFPLGIYDATSGVLLAAFAAASCRVPNKPGGGGSGSGAAGSEEKAELLLADFSCLALDRTRPPVVGPKETLSESPLAGEGLKASLEGKGRWLAAGASHVGCLALAFIADDFLSDLRRRFEAHQRRATQEERNGGQGEGEKGAETTQNTEGEAREKTLWRPLLLAPLKGVFVGERFVQIKCLAWRPRRRGAGPVPSASLHLLVGCGDGFVRVCAFTLRPQQQLDFRAPTLVRLANGQQDGAVNALVYVHPSARRVCLLAACNATDTPPESSALFARGGDAAANGKFHEVRVAEQTAEGGYSVCETLCAFPDFLVGLSASATAATFAALSADGTLRVYARPQSTLSSSCTPTKGAAIKPGEPPCKQERRNAEPSPAASPDVPAAKSRTPALAEADASSPFSEKGLWLQPTESLSATAPEGAPAPSSAGTHEREAKKQKQLDHCLEPSGCGASQSADAECSAEAGLGENADALQKAMEEPTPGEGGEAVEGGSQTQGKVFAKPQGSEEQSGDN